LGVRFTSLLVIAYRTSWAEVVVAELLATVPVPWFPAGAWSTAFTTEYSVPKIATLEGEPEKLTDAAVEVPAMDGHTKIHSLVVDGMVPANGEFDVAVQVSELCEIAGEVSAPSTTRPNTSVFPAVVLVLNANACGLVEPFLN
jgi:hypothetical protein